MTKNISESQEKFNEAREAERKLLEEKQNQPVKVEGEIDPFLGETFQTPVRRERPADLQVVNSGAGYHDFNKEPVFEGYYLGEFHAPKDIPANRTKAGDVIGYNFRDAITGKETILSNSHTIKDSLEKDNFNPSSRWWIEFEGKVTIKGKPFNKFFTAKR